MSTVREWSHATNYSKLPEKVRKKKKKMVKTSLALDALNSLQPNLPAPAGDSPAVPNKFGAGTGFGNISLSPTRSRLMKPTLKTSLKPHAPDNAVTSPVKMAGRSLVEMFLKLAADSPFPGGIPDSALPTNSKPLDLKQTDIANPTASSPFSMVGSSGGPAAPSLGSGAGNSWMPSTSVDYSKLSQPSGTGTSLGNLTSDQILSAVNSSKPPTSPPQFDLTNPELTRALPQPQSGPVDLSPVIDPRQMAYGMAYGPRSEWSKATERNWEAGAAGRPHPSAGSHALSDILGSEFLMAAPALRAVGAAVGAGARAVPGAVAAAEAAIPSAATAVPAAAKGLGWLGRQLNTGVGRAVTNIADPLTPAFNLAGRVGGNWLEYPLRALAAPGRILTGQSTIRNIASPAATRSGQATQVAQGLGFTGAAGLVAYSPSAGANPSDQMIDFSTRIKRPIERPILEAEDLLTGQKSLGDVLSGRLHDYTDWWSNRANSADRAAGNAVAEGKSIPGAALEGIKGFAHKFTNPIAGAVTGGVSGVSSPPDDSGRSRLSRGLSGMLTGAFTANERGNSVQLNPNRHHSLVGDNSPEALEQRTLAEVAKDPSNAAKAMSQLNPTNLPPQQKFNELTDDYLLSSAVGDSQKADAVRLQAMQLAKASQGKDMPLGMMVSYGPKDLGVSDEDFGKLIDGPQVDPQNPGPLARLTAKRNEFKTKYPQGIGHLVGTDKTMAESAQRELMQLDRDVQARAAQHYENTTIKPLTEKTLPDAAARATQLRSEIAEGMYDAQHMPAAIQELEQLRQMTTIGAQKVALHALHKSNLDGIVRRPGGDMATVNSLLKDMNSRVPVLDAAGNPVITDEGPLTKPATPTGQLLESRMATELARQAGEKASPSQVQSSLNSMQPLEKILLLGGLGIGAIGLVSTLMGGGSMGALMTLLGLAGAGAGVVMGAGKGDPKSLLSADTWRNAGSGLGSMFGIGASGRSQAATQSPSTNIGSTANMVSLQNLRSTPEYKNLATGSVMPDQARNLFMMIRPDEEAAALQDFAGNPAMSQVAQDVFSRRAAIWAKQPMNDEDAIAVAGPALGQIGLDSSVLMRGLQSIRNGAPDIIALTQIADGFKQIAGNPAKLAILQQKLPPRLKDTIKNMLTQYRGQVRQLMSDQEIDAIIGSL